MPSLPNLQEDFFLDTLLPPKLVEQDTRGILRAVVGAYQERVGDFRYAVNKVRDSYNPALAPPTGATRTIVTETYPNVAGDVGFSLSLGQLASEFEMVTVNGTVLVQSDSVPAGGSSSFAASIQGQTTLLLFGDGVNGAFVPPGATVVVVYATRSGDTLEVVYTSETGNTVRTVLDTDSTTPPAYDLVALTAWAAAQMQVCPTRIIGVTIGTDALRTVDASTLAALAATIGEVLYSNPLLSPAENIAAQRKQIEGFFPRLKIKGTATSFDVLGRLLGFGAVAMVPLWGRMSPRIPQDVGDPANDQDFSYAPQVLPSDVLPDPAQVYDPFDAADGPFYTWESGPLSVSPTSAQYYPYVVNQLNPYVSLVLSGVPVFAPLPGPYYLTGGAPYVNASVALNASMTLQAICDGDAFNGMRVDVVSYTDDTGAPQLQFVIRGRLSKIKYRTSLFDLSLAVDAEAFDASFGTQAVTANPDAGLLSGSNCQNGNPLGGYPLRYVSSTTRQHNFALLQILGAQAVQAFETVRPATRSPRSVSVGFLYEDELGYAPYSTRLQLNAPQYLHGSVVSGAATGFPTPFTTGGTIVQSGTVLQYGSLAYSYSNRYPTYHTGYTAEVFASKGSNLYQQTVERVPGCPDVLFVSGAYASGTYQLTSGSFRMSILQPLDQLYAEWVSTSTEAVRPNYVNGSYAYQARPEDELVVQPRSDLFVRYLGTDDGLYLTTNFGNRIFL